MSCSNLLWDVQTIARKEVPTIQDALTCCDKKTLLYVVERFYASRLPGWRDVSPQQRHVARKRMARALETMRQCSVKRKEGKGRCAFPYEEFTVFSSGGACTIERVLQARLVSVSNAQHGNPAKCGNDASLSFSCQPWSKALACRIWLEGPWDCQERYMILANVFWQLTHQGFGESSQEARLQKSWNPNASQAKQNSFVALRASGEMASAGSDGALKQCEQYASAGELHESQAAEMGLGVPEALEETYQERLIQRIARLNQSGEQDFHARVLRFSEKLNAA